MAKKAKSKKRTTKGPDGGAIPMDSYSARYDLETLQRAHEIAQDGKRFGAVREEAKKQREALDRFGRLKDRKL